MNGVATYLWIVEWDDSFVKPARVEVRQVPRRGGVSDEDLEHHMVDVEIPRQAAVSTRVGGVRRQLLVRLTGEHEETTGFGNGPEGVATPVADVAVVTGRNGVVVWRSDDED
jgi:hypothetical protein